MNVLYVAARYHTNQVPIMAGWIESGHNVTFLSQYRGKSEDYQILEPVVLGYSKLFNFFLKIYKVINGKKRKESALPELFEAKLGFPPNKELNKVLKEYKPDLVIMRDYSIYNLVIYFKCRKIPCILYTQTPYYVAMRQERFYKKILKRFFPRIMMTPVQGKRTGQCVSKAGTYYVPFVMNAQKGAECRRYCKDGTINILDVGKYEKRKNHIMLIEALQESGYTNYTLTIAGEVSTDNHDNYYNELEKLVNRFNQDGKIRLLRNVSREDIYTLYENADVFVLPSTGEWASISQLEAMSCGTLAICSDTNGTAEYIEDGKSGFIFKDGDKESLKKVLQYLFVHQDAIASMGQESLARVKAKYSFIQYLNGIETIMEKEF